MFLLCGLAGACGATGSPTGTGGVSGSGADSSGAAAGNAGAVAGGGVAGSSGAMPVGDPAGTGGGGSAADGGSGGTLDGAAGLGGGNAAGTGGGGTAGSSAAWCLPVSDHPMGIDWAKALIASQQSAIAGLGWQYFNGLFIHGVYLAYKRLGDAAYLSSVRSWADAHTGGVSTYNTLDQMQPTLVLNDMYRETHDAKYGTAPRAVADRLESDYPKTADGGFWHMTSTKGQLWGDGVFMNLPTYVAYGELFNHSKAVDVATEQLIIYDKHLATGDLHRHNWDETKNAQSCCVWCRAAGWYEMSILLVLDHTPPTHPNYAALVAIVQRLAKGVEATQDPTTGRWWQVMDRPSDAANWLETSCTAMHTYFLSKASEKGYIDAAHYAPLAIKGFKGEMQQVSNPDDPQILNICPGTGVLASPAEYYARPKGTNDQHGLGAFLLMYDQLTCR
jgi:unsaturated rhamnogalacturonyl hydrolase